ncbi:hypothetical protein MUG91_G960n5 [Manis pentadactyla]|nr:hypothetical protein MUG91_G960n5 [Manis pentadactyla]
MDKNQKGGGGRDKESPQQQLELAHTATEGPQPRNRQQHFYRNPFTGKEFAIPMGVTEASKPSSKPEKSD